MLVVLDNAREVEQVRPLLPGTPSCVTLVTSRDSLAGLVARDGAARLDLDLLPPADAMGLLRDLIGTGEARIRAHLGLVADGTSVTQAARTLKISRSTAYAALATAR